MGEFSAFEGGDKAIADEVRREIAVTNGKAIDVDSDDDDDDADDLIIRTDLFDLCRRVEAG
jgi:hypothetical protein